MLARALVHDLPNALTAARFVLAAALPLVALGAGSAPAALAVFVAAAATDALDGFAARRRPNRSCQARDLGASLDPLADKVLVLAALATLLAQQPALAVELVVPATVIFGREAWIVWARARPGGRGAMPVTRLSKAKTLVQMTACGALLFGPAATALGLTGFAAIVERGGVAGLSLGAALGLVSALDHVVNHRRAAGRRRAARSRRPPGPAPTRSHPRPRPGA